MGGKGYNVADRFPSNGGSKGFLEINAMYLFISSSNNTRLKNGRSGGQGARFNFKHPSGCNWTNARRKGNEIPCSVFNNRFVLRDHGLEPTQILAGLDIGERFTSFLDKTKHVMQNIVGYEIIMLFGDCALSS